MAKSELHKKLQEDAVYWLYKNGCEIFADEVGVDGGYIIDVVGIKRNGDTFCVEVKATQEDLDKARQEGYSQTNHFFNYHYLYLPIELELKNAWDGWGIVRDFKSIRKAKRQTSHLHFSELTKLMFDVAGKLAREKYFNNFRDTYE